MIEITFDKLIIFFAGFGLGWILNSIYYRQNLQEFVKNFSGLKATDVFSLVGAFLFVIIVFASILGGYKIDQELYRLIGTLIAGTFSSRFIPEKKE